MQGGAGTMAFQHEHEGMKRSEANVCGVLFPFDEEKSRSTQENNRVWHEIKPGKYNSKHMKDHLYIQANGLWRGDESGTMSHSIFTNKTAKQHVLSNQPELYHVTSQVLLDVVLRKIPQWRCTAQSKRFPFYDCCCCDVCFQSNIQPL